MDQKRIIGFLRQVMANNNRAWFQEHKAEYEAARAEFERGVAQAMERMFRAAKPMMDFMNAVIDDYE